MDRHYLASYNPKDYPAVLVTVDSVLLTFHDEQIKVLLVKRASHPQLGSWGLPGGFVQPQTDDSLVSAALRSVRSKTGVVPDYLEQLETVGSAQRDPRGWSVSVVYSALLPFQASQSHLESVDEAAWVAVADVLAMPLAFDHRQLIEQALVRYKQKALYSFVPVFALAQPFTLTELRKVHEALIGQLVQRKSFSRRVAASEMLIDTGQMRVERGRPATLYRARKEIANYRFVRNLVAD